MILTLSIFTVVCLHVTTVEFTGFVIATVTMLKDFTDCCEPIQGLFRFILEGR